MKSKVHSFLYRIFIFLPLLILLPGASTGQQQREFYQLFVYHFTTIAQEATLDNYFEKALLPALHRQGINKTGVFKSLANDTTTDKLIYILIPFTKLENIAGVGSLLAIDKEYQDAANSYTNAIYSDPPYTRKEVMLLQAFSMAPQLQLPALKGERKNRVYELRSYESATEKIFKNKVHMFNEGDEIGLFKRLNFNAVFYSEVIAGSKMPNLMYMTSFENMEDRNEHWKNFVADPYWKKLSAMPEYQKNVSRNDITFLYPTDYSDY